MNTSWVVEAVKLPADDAAGVTGHAQLIEHVVREAVRADAASDAGLHVADERIQRDAAPREHDRAMGHHRAAVAQQLEIVGMRIMDPRMIVEEDAMPDDRVRPQRADPVEPFDRRAPVAPDDLLELDDALRGMDLDRLVALARCRQGVADLPFGAGVDLRRAEKAGDPAATDASDASSAISMASLSACPGGEIEIVLDRVAIGGLPRARAEHAPQHGADAGLGIFVGPCVARAAEIADRRHAALAKVPRRPPARQGRVYSGPIWKTGMNSYSELWPSLGDPSSSSMPFQPGSWPGWL